MERGKSLNIFEYQGYKAYLTDRLEMERGLRSKLAKHLRCQSGFISQVLNGDRHFSLEHMIEIAHFLELSEDETDFLILLTHFERASSSHLKSYYHGRIHQVRSNRQRIPMREGKRLSEVELASFYAVWYHFAIYVYLEASQGASRASIIEALALEENTVRQSLNFLQSLGLAEEKKEQFFHKEGNVSVGRDSPFIDLVHKNFRLEVIRSLDQRKVEDAHYSQYFSATKETASWLQERVAEFKKEIDQELEARKKGKVVKMELYSLTIDCFRYGKE